MSLETPITAQIDAIRTETAQLLEQMVEKAEAFELPEATITLTDYHKKLTANNAQVLVVGEAKRGKSSFINALIGRGVLPVDVDIATSQVFRIRNTPHEAYRLRFEDGSTQSISAAELSRYGSQVVADREGAPGLAQIIRWIEIDIPTHFLPAGISVLDTPGLGGLYKAHAQITYRFVPYADAVLFILDSWQPILESELTFIDTLLNVTRNILFIQTKIDTVAEEEWQELRTRNQEILRTRFKDRLTDAHIWPISSSNLLSAVGEQEDDQDYLQASLYAELAAALQVSLFRATGWERAAQAIVVARDYQLAARKTLSERQAALDTESAQWHMRLQQEIARRKQAFEQAWGEAGSEKAALMEQIRATSYSKRQAFTRILQQGSDIEMTERRAIDNLTSLKEAQTYNSTLADHLIGLFMNHWQNTWEETRSACLSILARFLVVADALNKVEDSAETSIIIQQIPELVNGDITQLVKEQVMGEANLISNMLGVLSQVLSIFTYEEDTYGDPNQGSALNPLTNLATVCYIAIRGIILKNEMELEAAKRRLHQYLTDVLQSVRDQFQDRRLGNGYQSRIETFYTTLERAISDEIEQIVARKSEELRVELARLSEEANLSSQERTAKAAQVQLQRGEWQAFAATIKQITAGLKQIDESLR